jgi:hypothetical protein
VTWSPASSSRSVRCEPMKPAPPVMSACIVSSLSAAPGSMARVGLAEGLVQPFKHNLLFHHPIERTLPLGVPIRKT